MVNRSKCPLVSHKITKKSFATQTMCFRTRVTLARRREPLTAGDGTHARNTEQLVLSSKTSTVQPE